MPEDQVMPRPDLVVEQAKPMSDAERAKLIIEMRKLEMAEEKHAMEKAEAGVAIVDEDGRKAARAEKDVLALKAVENVAQVVSGLKEAVENQAQVIQDVLKKDADSREKAVEMLNKPKRIIREKGKIVGIE
jgi:hypothetical protein